MAAERRKASRKAAQSLRVSHPSLCEQIIDLETEFGTRLFERTNHHVSLKIVLVDRAQALFTLIGAEFGVGLAVPLALLSSVGRRFISQARRVVSGFSP
jgi:hypothetical protein